MSAIISSMYFSPEWFFGYDIVLELLFMLIILSVSYYSLKVYKVSGQREAKLFSLAFFFIAASYFVQSVVIFSIISTLNQTMSLALKLMRVEAINITGFFFQRFLFLLGLVTLIYMILKVKDRGLYFLLVILTVIPLLLVPDISFTFYLLSSIFLVYISSHYLVNYFRHKQKKTLLVLTAFLFLLFGSIHFIFSVNHSLFYVIGHFLELIAYALILINLLLVVRKR